MRITSVFLFLLIFLWIMVRITIINAQVRINEIGIEQSPQTIELINMSSDSADISHWYLDDSGGTTYYTIANETYLYPFSCMVFIYDLNLNKSTPDTARLFDSTAPPTSISAHLIDSYSYKLSPGNGLSYSRMPDGENSWTVTNATFGLWNSTPENCLVFPTPTATPIPTPTTISIPTPTSTSLPTSIPTISSTIIPVSYNSIFISEAMVYPEKNNPEWIELYNDNDFSVSLHNWFFDDLENEGSSPKLFSLELPAKQYRSIEFTSSLFNNDGDQVRLLDADKNEKDSFEYGTSLQGKTLGRISFESDSFCQQEPTKNSSNLACIESISKPLKAKTISIENNTLPTERIAKSYISSAFSTVAINNYAQSLQNNILGETTQNGLNTVQQIPFYQTPYYVSFTYSLLTIFSVLIKIKNAF